MSDWNPALHGRYEDERTRPARELLARVPLAQAARAHGELLLAFPRLFLVAKRKA